MFMSPRHCVPSLVLLLICGGPGLAIAAELLPPAIGIAGLHSPTWAAEGPQLKCRVRVANPNLQDLAVSRADIDLKLSATPAAKGRLPEKVVIPAAGVIEVDVIVNVLPDAALTWMPMFLGNSNFSVPFEVSGTIDVDNMNPKQMAFRELGEVEMTRQGIMIRPPKRRP